MTLIKGECPTCRAWRNAQVIAEHESVSDTHIFDNTVQANAHRILKCAGCDGVYFQHERLEITSDDGLFEDDSEWGEASHNFAAFKEFVDSVRLYPELGEDSPLKEEYKETLELYEEQLYWPR